MRKKRILVVTSDVTFVEGGHLTIARNTVQALRQHGYDADLVLTPQNRFGQQFRAYLANRFTDVELDGLGRRIDQIISFRFPSYAVKHPLHVCWLNHRMREYYDLWGLLYSQLGLKARLKERLRRFLIQKIDSYLLKHNVQKLYAQSQTIQKRLQRWGRIPSEVLYPPPPQRNYRTDSYQNFIFTVSRLQQLKRIDLFVRAFRHVKNKKLKAFIIGEGPEREKLSLQIKEYGLEQRVYLLGATDEENLMSHYSRCLAVFFCPLNEDYGLVTPEAFASRKAVITTTDSGGPAELVRDGESGFIVAPDPRLLAEKMDLLAENRNLAEKMGNNGYKFISHLTWADTIQKLILFKR
ncbi:MAG: glycosyltransferase family 4 protein [Candidatus Aminicenantales bacterium]